MKFITKFIIIYLVVTVIVLGISGFISYFIIRGEIRNELKWQFLDQIDRVTYLIEEGKDFTSGENLERDQNLVVKKLDYRAEPQTMVTDTMVWHERLEQNEPNVKVAAFRSIDGNSYYISTFGAMIETDDVQEAVIKILLWILGLQTIGAVSVGFVVSGRLFRPFRETLKEIKKFRLQDKKHIPANETGVEEFNELNRFVESMTRKAITDYKNLKEFTENASHELQTPLSVAKGKLELLTETDLDSEQHRYVDNLQKTVKKLSRLSESLALLTKIENHEFGNDDDVDFSRIVKEGIDSYREFVDLNNLTVEATILENVKLKINPVLAEIMWSNLYQNSIRHNIEKGIEKGEIRVELTSDYLKISNTGRKLHLEPAELFKRFRKGDQSSDSIGLGLSIIKRITDQYGFDLSYDYEDGWHRIQVLF